MFLYETVESNLKIKNNELCWDWPDWVVQVDENEHVRVSDKNKNCDDWMDKLFEGLAARAVSARLVIRRENKDDHADVVKYIITPGRVKRRKGIVCIVWEDWDEKEVPASAWPDDTPPPSEGIQ